VDREPKAVTTTALTALLKTGNLTDEQAWNLIVADMPEGDVVQYFRYQVVVLLQVIREFRKL